jgi:toxin HigB-1
LPAFARTAKLRLDRPDAATFVPGPGLTRNGWEVLKGDRKGQYSIRIDDQWRICFDCPKGSAARAL